MTYYWPVSMGAGGHAARMGEGLMALSANWHTGARYQPAGIVALSAILHPVAHGTGRCSPPCANKPVRCGPVFVTLPLSVRDLAVIPGPVVSSVSARNTAQGASKGLARRVDRGARNREPRMARARPVRPTARRLFLENSTVSGVAGIGAKAPETTRSATGPVCLKPACPLSVSSGPHYGQARI